MHIDPTQLDDLRNDRIQLTGPPVTMRRRPVVFPGAFHPLHEGHREMAAVAAAICEGEVDFELSIHNVDKPEIAHQEVTRRAAQFSHDQVLWMTRAATFAEKATIFPGSHFVIGADTAMRLANLWYYDGDLKSRDQALETLRRNDCRFLVFGRLVKDKYHGLEDLGLPEDWKSLCRGVSEKTFRRDISSSELRGK